jgi:hypothetical protein
MKRETRANLIFLTAFLALTLPGAVILFKKKLDPRAPAMFMPDYVRRRLPYMAPQLSPEQVVRFVPDLTGQWVTQLNRDHGGGGAQVLMNGHLAITTDDHLIQVVSIAPTKINLIAWDDRYGIDRQQYSISITSGAKAIAGQVRSAEKIPMPPDIKRELMDAGVIRPPAAITFLTVEFAEGLAKNDRFGLQVAYKQQEGDIVLNSSAKVVTNLVQTPH